MNTARLALAFTAGMIATINPCGFALLPAYLTYFLGLEEGEDGVADPATGTSASVLRAVRVSAAVTLGFVSVFAIMGVLWSTVSGVVASRLPYVTMVIGLGLIVLGVAMFIGFEPTIRLPRLQLSNSGREFSSMFLYGISYAIASLSCTIGVFISIVSTTLDDGDALASIATFVAYALGMGATLAVLTVGVALARTGVLRTFRRLLPHMQRISAVLLVLAGVFVIYYAWVETRELGGGSTSSLVAATRDLQSAIQSWIESVGAGWLAFGSALLLGVAIGLSLAFRGSGPRDDDRVSDGTGIT